MVRCVIGMCNPNLCKHVKDTHTHAQSVLDVCTLCEVADVCSPHLAVMEDSLHCLISLLHLGIASPV